MRKDLGKQPAVFPMPVLMVTAYDENGTVQVMNAAWGMICGMDKIALFIDEDHATTKAIRKTKAFTVSLADRDHMDAADYYGIATGNKMPDKFEKSGYHAQKSVHVNAPIITEFPVALECELAEITETENIHQFLVCPVLSIGLDERKLIHLEFLVLGRVRIVESPLLERDISADEVDQPAVLLIKLMA